MYAFIQMRQRDHSNEVDTIRMTTGLTQFLLNFFCVISSYLAAFTTSSKHSQIVYKTFTRYSMQFYILFISFLLTINLKLIIVHVEIKIVNKEAATKRSTLLHAQYASPSNRLVVA